MGDGSRVEARREGARDTVPGTVGAGAGASGPDTMMDGAGVTAPPAPTLRDTVSGPQA